MVRDRWWKPFSIWSLCVRHWVSGAGQAQHPTEETVFVFRRAHTQTDKTATFASSIDYDRTFVLLNVYNGVLWCTMATYSRTRDDRFIWNVIVVGMLGIKTAGDADCRKEKWKGPHEPLCLFNFDLKPSQYNLPWIVDVVCVGGILWIFLLNVIEYRYLVYGSDCHLNCC